MTSCCRASLRLNWGQFWTICLRSIYEIASAQRRARRRRETTGRKTVFRRRGCRNTFWARVWEPAQPLSSYSRQSTYDLSTTPSGCARTLVETQWGTGISTALRSITRQSHGGRAYGLTRLSLDSGYRRAPGRRRCLNPAAGS